MFVADPTDMFVAHVNTASGFKMIAVGFATVLAIIFAHERKRQRLQHLWVDFDRQ